MKTGDVKEKTVTIRLGDSLAEKASRSEYDGFDVEEINPGGNFIRFANNMELSVGDSSGEDKDAIFEAQIRYTIEEHFRKQERLKEHGVKVLSLFFIDRVSNYVDDDGVIRKIFDQAFNEMKTRYDDWSEKTPDEVRAAYFAQKRRRGGAIEFLDSVSGETKEDTAAYELIMKRKEVLLSFSEPVSFIFSHSALREGWDNPNVFQICTLNQTSSEMKKRQEVGRGMRLCRDQSGDRVHDDRINVLTVVANESYERYVETLQSEIEPTTARRVRLPSRRMLGNEVLQSFARICTSRRFQRALGEGETQDPICPPSRYGRSSWCGCAACRQDERASTKGRCDEGAGTGRVGRYLPSDAAECSEGDRRFDWSLPSAKSRRFGV
jgi:restriction endonuclease